MTTLPDLADLNAGDAEWYDQVAIAKRASAVGTTPTHRAQQLAEANGLEALATALRDPNARGAPVMRQGRAGEVAPADDPDLPWRQREIGQTVAASPGMLAADATLSRLSLARDGNVLTLAVATAQDAGAVTSTEQCLAHQFAASHRLTMELLALASDEAHKYRKASTINPNALVEAARTATAASRLMDACTRSALAQDRLRNGGRQIVTVQHIDQRVAVATGGAAIVGGNMALAGGIAAPQQPTEGRRAK